MTDKPQEKNSPPQESIARLQILEQNLQAILMQKQQFQTQLLEIESALKEIQTSKSIYKIVGNIMVHTEKPDIEKDLQQKKEFIDLRIKNMEKQEKQLNDKTKQLREDVMKHYNK